MSAMLTWICDECGTIVAKDVSDDAAMGFKVTVLYPPGWYVGDEKTACALTTCQAAVMAHDHYLSDSDGDTRDTL